jgi:hypothetical protein
MADLFQFEVVVLFLLLHWEVIVLFQFVSSCEVSRNINSSYFYRFNFNTIKSRLKIMKLFIIFTFVFVSNFDIGKRCLIYFHNSTNLYTYHKILYTLYTMNSVILSLHTMNSVILSLHTMSSVILSLYTMSSVISICNKVRIVSFFIEKNFDYHSWVKSRFFLPIVFSNCK